MQTSSRSSPLPIVFLIVFLDLLGIGILIPIVPQLLANPESPFFLLPAGWTLAQGYILLGLLVTVFPFMQFLATPILGELSDKFGRRPVLLFSLAGTCLSYILFGVAIHLRHIPLLFISRALDGITGGNIAVAQAVISDTTAPDARARSFGLIGAAFGLGFILGPYLGGKLSDPSGFTFFTTFFGVFLIDRFRFTQGDIGDFFSYMGLWIVFAQALVVRPVSRAPYAPLTNLASLVVYCASRMMPPSSAPMMAASA
jgi:MFS family permease